MYMRIYEPNEVILYAGELPEAVNFLISGRF